MIQFNLLPDVKLDFIKVQRTKRAVVAIALITSALAVFVFVVLFLAVNVAQKGHLNRLNDDIEQYTKELEETPNLTQILTIQNQLTELTGLHDEKPIVSRIGTYLAQLTPRDAKIAEVDIDFSESTIEISGSATSLEVVNKYVDTLKFTDYVQTEDEDGLESTDLEEVKAFSSVELDFSIDQGNERSVRYTIKSRFDETIFDATKFIALRVPNIISTRSNVERPSDLFETAPVEDDQAPTQGGTQ